MRIICLSLFAFALIGRLNADVRELVSQNELAQQNAIATDAGLQYLPPVKSDITKQYLPPVKSDITKQYLPPVKSDITKQYLPPVKSDVTKQYLPPAATNVNAQYLPPQTYEQDAEVPHNEEVSNVVHEEEVILKEPEPKPAHELKADGYHYKKPAKFAYRIRRDVASEQQYLPPDVSVENAEIQDSEPAHVLTDNGYAYKTQKRVVYRRNRRDVAHLSKNAYLAPLEDSSAIAVEASAADSQIALFDSSSDIIDNRQGYGYKVPQTAFENGKRRHRRDVSHVTPDRSYLAPLEDSSAIAVEASAADSQIGLHDSSSDIIDNRQGYGYKVPQTAFENGKRRHRRDVPHVTPDRSYLAPLEDSSAIAVEASAADSQIALSDSSSDIIDNRQGYGYRVPQTAFESGKRRHRRDVSHVTPDRSYLAPLEDSSAIAVEASAADSQIALSDSSSDIIDNRQGYGYKVPQTAFENGKRRHRREVSHVTPDRSYLAPLEYSSAIAVEASAADSQIALSDSSSDIIDNRQGYGYRVPQTAFESGKRRHRRDVSHVTPDRSYLAPLDSNNINSNSNLNAQYLPPSNAVEAEPAHELLSDGYHYKTNRRVVYHHF